jgi:DNA-directed RNA polymerase specialized sigma24 family protein
MKGAAMALEQDQRISELLTREQSRLRNFIRRRVPDTRDVEDILHDIFYQLVEANRLLMPIDHVTGWLFRVARNRITDLSRRASVTWPLRARTMNCCGGKTSCPRPTPA